MRSRPHPERLRSTTHPEFPPQLSHNCTRQTSALRLPRKNRFRGRALHGSPLNTLKSFAGATEGPHSLDEMKHAAFSRDEHTAMENGFYPAKAAHTAHGRKNAGRTSARPGARAERVHVRVGLCDLMDADHEQESTVWALAGTSKISPGNYWWGIIQQGSDRPHTCSVSVSMSPLIIS